MLSISLRSDSSWLLRLGNCSIVVILSLIFARSQPVPTSLLYFVTVGCVLLFTPHHLGGGAWPNRIVLSKSRRSAWWSLGRYIGMPNGRMEAAVMDVMNSGDPIHMSMVLVPWL